MGLQREGVFKITCSKYDISKHQILIMGNSRDNSVVETTVQDNLDSIPSTHMMVSQPFITPAPEDPMPSSSLQGHQACIQCTDRRLGKTAIHIKQK